MAVPEEVWAASTTGALRQCELLSAIWKPVVELLDDDTAKVGWTIHPWALILSQDCDTAFDYTLRNGGIAVEGQHKELPSVLLVEAFEEAEVRAPARSEVKSDIWRRIRDNQDERFHTLDPVPPELDAYGQGVPSLVLDFKRVFTLPTGPLYLAIEHSSATDRHVRRSYLIPPFRDFVSTRAFAFMARVAVPE